MALIFKLSGDSSDLDRKLNQLPQKAEQAGQKVGQAMDAGLKRTVNASAHSYARQMQASMAKAMQNVTPAEESSQRKRASKLAEIAAREDAKARDYWAREDRQKDKQRMRTLAQARKQEDALSDEGGSSRSLLSVMRSAAVLAAAHAVARTYTEFRESKNNIAIARAGLTDDQLGKVSSFRRSAMGSTTTAGRADLSESINSEIEAEMDRKTRAAQNMSGFEQFSDAWENTKKKLFGSSGEKIVDQYKAASDSRIKSLRRELADNIETARNNEAFVNGQYAQSIPGMRAAGFEEKLSDLVHQRNTVGNLSDPSNVEAFQRWQSQIKGMLPYLQETTQQYRQQVDMARGGMSAGLRLRAIASERAVINSKLSGPDAIPMTMDQRRDFQGRLQDLSQAEFGAQVEQFNRTLDVGLSGPNARREAARQQRREQREINRMGRMATSGAKEARAFQGDLINPRVGRDAATDQMMAGREDAVNGKDGTGKLDAIHGTLQQILQKVAAPATLQ